MPLALTSTHLTHPSHRGKVRDIYDLGDVLLLVATDRLSAFDVVLPTGIPEKGVVLNELSLFWFEKTSHIVPNHFIAMGTDNAKVAQHVPELSHEIARRAMLVHKAEPIRVECVVRGYLAGSAWAEYRKQGTIGGEPAPRGLRDSERLEKPLFTPTTKAAVGHDELISKRHMSGLVGSEITDELERLTIAVYNYAHAYALTKGIIIADTKLEFGMVGDTVTLIDEVLTPDSSRFWSSTDFQPGRPQGSLDKQFVRDWLENSGWNKEPPGPELPQAVVDQTASRYKDVFQRLTGQPLP